VVRKEREERVKVGRGRMKGKKLSVRRGTEWLSVLFGFCIS